MHEREACSRPVLAEKFSLILHTGVSGSCSYSCTSSWEAFPTLQKLLTYQMPYERFTVLQGCWFYLLCCGTILKSYSKARWTTWRNPLSLSTAGLFISSRYFCSFPDLKQWSSRVTLSFGWNKTLLWVCLAIVKESERLKHKMLDSGYSWVSLHANATVDRRPGLSAVLGLAVHSTCGGIYFPNKIASDAFMSAPL